MCMLPETEAPTAPTLDVLERNLRDLRQQRDELLFALTKLLDRTSMDYYPVEQALARVAIAKAEGRP